jgi:26S proteasome regulatory subunit T6
VHSEGKYISDIEASVDQKALKTGLRVALRSDSYQLYKILPSKIDPLVSLMMVEKVPDSTYDMIGGLDQQIKEIKEVIELPIKHPAIFEGLGIAQPKVRETLFLFGCQLFLGCSPLRTSWHWKNAACPRCCASH